MQTLQFSPYLEKFFRASRLNRRLKTQHLHDFFLHALGYLVLSDLIVRQVGAGCRRGDGVIDTTQLIDTRQLLASIEEELLRSNVVDFTSSIGTTGDSMINEARKLRDSDEFDQGTVQAMGQLIGPDLSVSGKIFERVVHYDNHKKQVEYYIELIVTDLRTGLRFWQKQVRILKRGGKKVPIW